MSKVVSPVPVEIPDDKTTGLVDTWQTVPRQNDLESKKDTVNSLQVMKLLIYFITPSS